MPSSCPSGRSLEPRCCSRRGLPRRSRSNPVQGIISYLYRYFTIKAKEVFTYSKEQSAVGRACAGDLDGDALRVWNAVAVAGARGVDAGLHPELGNERGVDAAAGGGGGG